MLVFKGQASIGSWPACCLRGASDRLARGSDADPTSASHEHAEIKAKDCQGGLGARRGMEPCRGAPCAAGAKVLPRVPFGRSRLQLPEAAGPPQGADWL
mmetsp:Transcript_93630/g.227470  ORF Transcript_93630/g.227470 Transcript_93630/m.227470 type:complete len:99 (+) Transcript_93630:516-812(+)